MKAARSGTRAVAVAASHVVAPFQESDRLHARVPVPVSAHAPVLQAQAAGSGAMRPAQAVVELRRGMGGIMWRALLGGTWEPGESDPPMVALDVAVSGAPESPERVPSLLQDRYGLRPGLPEEFAAKVLEGLEDAVAAGCCPAGVLTVDRAAFDDESSGLIFAAAARVLVRVLLAISAGSDSLEAAADEMREW